LTKRPLKNIAASVRQRLLNKSRSDVRRVSGLSAASFRSHLAMGTLAVRLTIPLAGPVEDLHLQVNGLPDEYR